MASLTAAVLCVLCVAQPVAGTQTAARWQPIITGAATRFALPADWIVRVMQAESGGQTTLHGQPITSPAGAMGLMQVMPDTYAAMRQTYHLGADPYDPHDNILAGTAFLRRMYDRYGYPNLFAAYNAGPGRFEDFLYRQRPLPTETRTFVARVLGGDSVTSDAPDTPDALTATDTKQASYSALFFVREGQPINTSLTPDLPVHDGALFVPLSRSAR